MKANVADDKKQIATTLCSFLNEIGLNTSFSEVGEETFLPGIAITDGRLIIDIAKLIWPGDLLHEAGHLALVPANERSTIIGEVTVNDEHPQTVEAAAMVWSYAAALHVGIDPQLIFHSGGYYGKGEKLLYTFNLGITPGLNLLEKLGLAYGPIQAAELDVLAFPHMQKWLRG